MDSARANREGAAPIADELARIAGLKSSAAIGGELARLQRMGVPAAFTPLVLPDFKNATRYLAALTQGDSGCPPRGIYLAPDSSAARVVAFCRDHIARSLALLGESSALADSEAVAATHRDGVGQRDRCTAARSRCRLS